ncbi:MAG: hypothetical protein CM15mP103_02580 [Gammaproteobacteria bacterium]|nr:MAG: hypothetical protein CM15mP103_02580 [Gammaproteobacteria bacterium]
MSRPILPRYGAQGKTAFHHLCYWTDDLDREIESPVEQARGGSDRYSSRQWATFAYVDTSPVLGHMTELFTYSDDIKGSFDGGGGLDRLGR